MKQYKKAVLSAVIFSLCIRTCFPDVSHAAAPERIKDETVYVNLTSSGRIDSTVVVNAFKVNGRKKIADYGNYENIKNLSGEAKPSVNNGYIEFEVDPEADMFYYQGELKNVKLPWEFDIKYFLDGKELTGEELIGKSGNVEIVLEAKSNPAAGSYFADNYLAQITIILDTDKFKNIVCTDAMTATIGSNKQLSLMVLPGMNKTYRVSAVAEEFETDGISIAMVKVSDSINEKLDGLKVSLNDMASGIEQLTDATGQLKNGSEDLSEAVSLLNGGVASVARVTPSLISGMDEIDRGAWNIYEGSKRLSSASALIRGGLGELDSKSIDIIKGTDTIIGGLNEMSASKNAVKAGINELNKSKSGINELSSGISVLSDGYKKIEDGLAETASKKEELSAGLEVLKGSDTDISALSGGLDTLKSGISELSYANAQQRQIIDALIAAAGKDPNLAPYAEYLGTMQFISKSMGDGFSAASSGIDTLSAGVDTAQEGINTLYSAAETFGNSAIALTDAAETMHGGMKELNGGFGKLSGSVGNVNKLFNAANSFADSSLKLAEGAEKIAAGAETLKNGLSDYTEGVNTLAVNYIELDNGIYELENGALALSGGTTEMYAGIDSVSVAINEIGDNMNKLDTSAARLPAAMDSFRLGGGQILQALSSPIGNAGSIASMSADAAPVSFAAPGIVTPKSVQFAMKTPNLHIPDETPEDEQPEKVGFIKKLINLFKPKSKKDQG
ncbi:MAG: hypothetical protein J1F64_03515 [Oscillospiraceae bacterium]|nr:hypothetical protein [Oscillospiraceae bacterium]